MENEHNTKHHKTTKSWNPQPASGWSSSNLRSFRETSCSCPATKAQICRPSLRQRCSWGSGVKVSIRSVVVLLWAYNMCICCIARRKDCSCCWFRWYWPGGINGSTCEDSINVDLFLPLKHLKLRTIVYSNTVTHGVWGPSLRHRHKRCQHKSLANCWPSHTRSSNHRRPTSHNQRRDRVFWCSHGWGPADIHRGQDVPGSPSSGKWQKSAAAEDCHLLPSASTHLSAPGNRARGPPRGSGPHP